jgi:hypothetical protein
MKFVLTVKRNGWNSKDVSRARNQVGMTMGVMFQIQMRKNRVQAVGWNQKMNRNERRVIGKYGLRPLMLKIVK